MSRRRVLVTGSSRGIGRAIAVRLADAGWNVAVHYANNEVEANETAKALGRRESGIYRADLAQASGPDDLLKQALADGPLHALVNNAGVYLPIRFAEAGDAIFAANWHKTFTVNFDSPLRLIRGVLPGFRALGGGKILNVASRVGFRGEPGASLYAASKAALINMTRSLAVELASDQVGVFGIAPGWVDTAMARTGMDDRLNEILASIPLGRMASPEDCAAASAFLLSDDASYLSGHIIDINGASYFH
jgi:3-oxoacyl-[acyl-carrier protein] reductase